MAKLALINREDKRRRLVQKYADKRAELKAIIDDPARSEEERMSARLKLQALPRNANPTRLRNRCKLTGRRAGCSASSACVATRSVSSPCRARFPASSRPAGKEGAR